MQPPRDNPWGRRSRSIRFDNAWMQVREDEVERPDGSPGLYAYAHFKNVAVAVLPLWEGEHGVEVVLVGQWRYTLGLYSWEIPAGGCAISGSESTLETARRELCEETGLEAREMTLLGHGHLSNSITDEATTMYLARGLEPARQRLSADATEELAVKRLPWDELLSLIASGAVTDGLTLVTVLRYQLSLRR